MRLAEPAYLLLLLPAIAILWLGYRRVSGMMRWRKAFALGIRALLLLLLILALSGPEMRSAKEGLCTIFVLDRSDSVREEDRAASQRFVEDALSKMRPGDLAGVVVFGKDAAVDAAPGSMRSLGRVLSVVDGTESDLASAVRLASAAFPDGKARRIVLLSDGNETTGEVSGAVHAAAADGVQVDVVPLGSAREFAEVSVIETRAPTEVPSGQPFELRVMVDASRATSARLVVDRDGRIVSDQNHRLSAGTNVLVVGQRLDEPGFARYRATLYAAADRDNRNNTGLGFVQVRGKPRALVLQERPGSSPLADALRQQGLAVDVYGPDGVPVRPEEAQAYDAVVFNDINAASMTPAQMKLLQAAIRDTGIGFAMVGGEDSFLPGGYYGSPIAEALPVDLNIRQRKTFPSTSIVIVIDASGSMSMVEDGHQKIRLAGKAAEQTVQLMSPLDRVGVAGSTDGIEFVAPLQKLDDKGAVIAQIRRLSTGGGGIYVRPSLEFAYAALRKENTKVRHLILLADGADCDQTEGCVELATLARADKITTSVVAIGDGKDVPFLKLLARSAGGRFYLAQRAGQLPAIFTQDAAVMSRSAIEEGVFLPKSTPGEEVLSGIPPNSVPALFAYCLTEARPLARVGMRTHKDDPLLAAWQYGLGASLAFTSDAQPRWAARWVPWSGFGQFWAQAVRSVSRRASAGGVELSTRHDGSRGAVELRVSDPSGGPVNNLSPTVRVATPSGEPLEVRLVQTAPGAYSGTFAASDIGTYIVAYGETSTGPARIATSGVSLAYPAEYRSFRPNRPLLEGLAKSSGGAVLAKPEEAARPRRDPGYSIRELAPAFLLAAAILLPFDVAVRRIALPLAEAFAAVLAFLRARRARERRVAQPEPIGRLRQAKERARTRIETATEDSIRPDGGAQPDTQTPDSEHPSSQRAERRQPEGSVGSRLLQAKKRREGAVAEEEPSGAKEKGSERP